MSAVSGFLRRAECFRFYHLLSWQSFAHTLACKQKTISLFLKRESWVFACAISILLSWSSWIFFLCLTFFSSPGIFFSFSLVWCFHSTADNVCLCLNERILNSLFHCLLYHSSDGFMFIRTYYLSWNSFLWPVFLTKSGICNIFSIFLEILRFFNEFPPSTLIFNNFVTKIELNARKFEF